MTQNHPNWLYGTAELYIFALLFEKVIRNKRVSRFFEYTQS